MVPVLFLTMVNCSFENKSGVKEGEKIASTRERPRQNLPEGFNYGKLSDTSYVNAFFDIKLFFNPSWVIIDDSTNKVYNTLGAEKGFVGDKGNMNPVSTGVELLSISKYELEHTRNENPALKVIAEQVKNIPEIKSGKDYLEKAKAYLSNSNQVYNIGEVQEAEIFGKTYYTLKVQIPTLDKHPYFQEFFTSVVSGFTITLVLSYESKAGRNELIDMLDLKSL